MGPVWQEAYNKGIRPYTHNEPIPGLLDQKNGDRFDQAMKNTLQPLRKFMSDQIEMTGNSDAVWMFLEYQHRNDEGPLEQKYKTYDDVPLSALLPAFMLSELKTAFLIGFQIYLPFVIIDLVVASITISMGMLMLPPVLISLPFKLLLFVLVDGWTLVVQMLLDSFQMF
jgi:flagellar biosynthetic protein FliP